MKVKEILVAEEYTAKDGSKKTAWKRIGTFFDNEQGRQSLKLDFVPVGWNGNAIVSEPKPRENTGTTQGPQQGQQTGLPF